MASEGHIKKVINGIDINSIDKHPNILIAASFWDEERYHAARVCYRFMRAIDDMVDDRKSNEETISCLEKQLLSDRVQKWVRCLEDNSVEDPEVLELVNTIDTFKLPLRYFHNFALAMQYDIEYSGFPTFNSFLEYAEGASVAPASIFVHLCCLNKENGSYNLPDIDVLNVARPCAIFSYLVHVIRDFQKDQKENLNYFAEDILQDNKLSSADLKEIALSGNIPPEFRNVVKYYKDRAGEYKEQTLEQINYLRGRVNGKYMMSLEIIYKLYLSVYNRIDVENGSFTSEELSPSNEDIAAMVMDF